MTIYLDALFLLNFYFDFLLLLTVCITLKRNASLKRIALGAFIGSLSIITLFIPMSNLTLIFFKFFLGALMVSLTFKIKDKKYFLNNLAYFYMISTILGGFLYFWNLSFSEEVHGFIFVKKDISINYLFLILSSPVILYFYFKQRQEIEWYQNLIPVTIQIKNGPKLTLNAFLDTGNKLVDPVTKKKIILVNSSLLKGLVKIHSPMYVAYNSLNNHGLLKCFSLDFLEIFGHKSQDYLIGLSEQDLLKDGVECVLNSYCLKEIKND